MPILGGSVFEKIYAALNVFRVKKFAKAQSINQNFGVVLPTSGIARDTVPLYFWSYYAGLILAKCSGGEVVHRNHGFNQVCYRSVYTTIH